LFMNSRNNFTEGSILAPLLRFAVPVLFALFLQAMYGAVDLLVVGQFAFSADVSAVATGSQIMQTVTNLISSLATGTTVLLGQKIGEKKAKEGGHITGASIWLFFIIGMIFTVLLTVLAGPLARIMNAPREAFELTKAYIRICGAGSIVIIAYNLIGGIFRGIGDSTTPFITVAIACVCNIFGDLLLVAVVPLGAAGAAIATVFAQLISVVISFRLIRRKQLPFEMHRVDIRCSRSLVYRILSLGIPLALQDFLVGMSFLIILAIVNSLGLTASAGVGVAEKVCGFIMLVPAAFMQSMSAFTAQNKGAGRMDRAFRGLVGAIAVSLACGCVMGWFSFFHGTALAGIFSRAPEVVAAAAEYLKAYSFDCILTSFLFCFVGFYNGIGMTKLVMIQGIVGAIGVRVPVSYFMSLQRPVSLFHIGLATPCSSFVQILFCIFCLFLLKKHGKLQKRAS
jgi:putative MATE family efflux protein